MSRTISRLRTWGSFVKFEHTLFSLPLLYAGAVLAAGGMPSWWTILWILGAGTGARTAALALNRIIDRHIDAANPRTADRELPRGAMKLSEALAVVTAGLLLYLISCAMLAPICLLLSPVPLAAFVIYPYLKRLTLLAHLGVGVALAFAPLGGYVAVTGSLREPAPALWLATFTLLWVAGFDIIYATLDQDFDRRAGIHSMPALLGRGAALRVAALFHMVAVASLVGLYVQALAGVVAVAGLVAIAGVLVAENRLAQRVNLAFFHLNIVVGFLVFGVVVAGKAGQ
ncbi:MAG: UbiA-like polyprenyltransferase [Acidobacteriota bacterium]